MFGGVWGCRRDQCVKKHSNETLRWISLSTSLLLGAKILVGSFGEDVNRA